MSPRRTTPTQSPRFPSTLLRRNPLLNICPSSKATLKAPSPPSEATTHLQPLLESRRHTVVRGSSPATTKCATGTGSTRAVRPRANTAGSWSAWRRFEPKAQTPAFASFELHLEVPSPHSSSKARPLTWFSHAFSLRLCPLLPTVRKHTGSDHTETRLFFSFFLFFLHLTYFILFKSLGLGARLAS